MTTLSPIPPFPALSDRASGTYNTKAYAFGTHMAEVFQPEMAAIADEVSAAGSVAADAVTSASIAVAAANFKGNWTGKTGAMNMPASVAHRGSMWVLTVNLPNVAAAEPGVNSAWAPFVSLAQLHAAAMSF